MTGLAKRVAALEQSRGGGGKFVAVRLCHDDFTPMTAQEEATALAAAHAQAGPGGDVLIICYVDNWREGRANE